MIAMISWMEITVIFLVVLLVFGAKRIPEFARALGTASREFKKAKDGVISEVDSAVTADQKSDQKADQNETKG